MATLHSLLVPQNYIHYNVPYIHVSVGYPLYPHVILMRKEGNAILCRNYDNEAHEMLVDEARFLMGEYVPMRELPVSVLYASHAYYEQVTCVMIFKSMDAIFWHGGINDRDLITAYELRNLPVRVIEDNGHVFAPYNYYNNGGQLLQIFERLFADAWQPKPHNYTRAEILKTLESGVLKPFPVVAEKPKAVEVIAPKNHAPRQLSLF